MDRLFRIDFYPQEWLVQTARMTIEQRGIFIQIVCMIYANRGPIENDAHHIGRASNCSSRMARAIIQQLVNADDLQIQGSKLSQKRCERELNIKRTHLEHSAKGGRTRHENAGECNDFNSIGSSPNPVPVPDSNPDPDKKEFSKKGGRQNGKQNWNEDGQYLAEKYRREQAELDAGSEGEPVGGVKPGLPNAEDIRQNHG